jgi:exonuclease SbcC
MWTLIQVYAKNLCAFKLLDYKLLQKHTTLIFGNNMDNDSQGSNGSGKSAMLEAIAIGITGETLRKIKMDEIINDAENEAIVSLLLLNTATGQRLTIQRIISRKAAQVIKVFVCANETEDNEVCIEQASVADYNKFILETLGLTKEDIFSNFILSKHKYLSFLSSSDREKKEIINRFSNGVIVDESIIALQEDMVPIQELLKQAELSVANHTGRVETLQEQINTAITESTERSQKKAERIANWNKAIADKRNHIREQNILINKANEILDQYDKTDKVLQKLENGKKDAKECFEIISEHFASHTLPLPRNFAAISIKNQKELEVVAKEYAEVQKQLTQHDKKIVIAKDSYDKLLKQYEKFQEDFDKKSTKAEEKINMLLSSVNKLETDNSRLRTQRVQLEADIADLQKQLAGVIVCPKCQHEFTLANDIDINDVKLKLQDRKGESQDILNSIETNERSIAEITAEGRKARQEQDRLNNCKIEWSTKITETCTALDELSRGASSLANKMQALQNQMNILQKSIEGVRVNLFDDAYAILDEAIQRQESEIKRAELNINNANGAIQSYEESIHDIENASETDMIETLKANKKKYEKELTLAISQKENVEQRLNSYKEQEATFIEFKTHLANTKIDALSHITNEFLEAIGSDIRIAFSGFTVLKSGKIRDKISISIIRDGVDCGSFDKFSEGEKARVNLANILAMHKLTNINCDDNKGLDLLILDEILEATDEQGLSNIFDALNQLQITSLVVSHGNIAENYPYKTVVNKLNGISFIDA